MGFPLSRPCPACDGRGHIEGYDCDDCARTGELPAPGGCPCCSFQGVDVPLDAAGCCPICRDDDCDGCDHHGHPGAYGDAGHTGGKLTEYQPLLPGVYLSGALRAADGMRLAAALGGR